MHTVSKLLRPRSASTRPLLRSLASSEPPSSSTPSQKRNPLTEVLLTEPLPGLTIPSKSISSVALKKEPQCVSKTETNVTTLSNGLRVASVPNPGRFCTVGVIIDSGSRYEVAFPSGVSHFVEKLAFGSTELFRNRDDILNRLEKFGGICDCQSTRDSFIYAASVETRGLEATVEVLGDVVLRPRILEEELDYARAAIDYEIQDTNMKPDQETLLTEAIHAVAFSNNTLGLPKLCPHENLNVINRDIVKKFLSQYHTPSRMVLGGVGVDHDELVAMAEKYFVHKSSSFATPNVARPDTSVSQYTGGLLTIEKDLSNASLGPTPMPDLAHVAIGLESVSHQHPDFIAFCVLNALMGGGGSFSAGGPGKGMYTRLYTHVLNRYHWMYAATAYNHAYSDGGVFCINASAPPNNVGPLVEVITSELANLTKTIGEEEFERAKKQLTSMLLMNLEARPVIFEDMVRQVLAQGKRNLPEHYIELIRAVTSKDINRIAEKMLAGKPAIAAIGNLKKLPEYKEIQLSLLERKPAAASKSRFNIFKD